MVPKGQTEWKTSTKESDKQINKRRKETMLSDIE